MLGEDRGKSGFIADLVALEGNAAFVLAPGLVEFAAVDAGESKDSSEMNGDAVAVGTLCNH